MRSTLQLHMCPSPQLQVFAPWEVFLSKEVPNCVATMYAAFEMIKQFLILGGPEAALHLGFRAGGSWHCSCSCLLAPGGL